MSSTKRVSISKKDRFEIFKRDSFKCQYCGKSAPEVVLEVDHIVPVSKGGDNEMFNLVTACFDCNRGKSNRELSDNTVIKQQKEMLDDINEKRIQLEMLKDWRDEMKELENEEIDMVSDYFEYMFGRVVSDYGKSRIKKWLKKYSVGDLMDAIDKAEDQYDNADFAFDKIPGIAYFDKKEQSDEMMSLYYCRGIMRKRYPYVNEKNAMILLKRLYEHGVELERIKEIVLQTKTWTQFKHVMEYEEGILTDC